jgi:hypothetical protein
MLNIAIWTQFTRLVEQEGENRQQSTTKAKKKKDKKKQKLQSSQVILSRFLHSSFQHFCFLEKEEREGNIQSKTGAKGEGM